MQNRNLVLLMVIGILLGSMMVTSLNYIPNWGVLPNEQTPKIDQNPSPSILTPQEDVSKNSINGAGEDIKVGFYVNVTNKITLNTPVKEEPGYKYFNLPINTNYQNISQTNLTFSGITAKNSLQIIEDNPENFIVNALESQPDIILAFMSIKISSPCKLKQVRLFLQEVDLTALWSIYLLNATRDLEQDLNVFPDTPTGVVISQPAATIETQFAAHWQNFTFPDTQLNMTNTYIDSKGFAYYFIMIALPMYRPAIPTGVSFLYYSFDVGYIDNGFAYFAVYDTTPPPQIESIEYKAWDYCMKLVLAPISPTPTPSDVGLSVFNPSRPAPTTILIEDNHSIPVEAAHNVTTSLHILSQNFTLSEYGTINGIGLYVKCYGNVLICAVGIFPDNGSKPDWNANKLRDLNMTLNLLVGTTGWINFTMIDLPTLPPGPYWWVLEVVSSGNGNITLFGASDSYGDNAIALNTVASGNPVQFTTTILPYDFASIIYYQPGKEVYNVSESWISTGHLLPDISGYVTFQIITRWVGDTAFNVTYTVELENNRYIEPFYLAYFDANTIWWNITLVSAFPTTSLGKIINLTLPLYWSVKNVTRNGQDHGSINWSVHQFTAYQILSIYRASNAQWTIWCNTTSTTVTYIVEKLVGTQFQPASNATVYDRLRVNITIPTQSNGICFITIFYPDGKSIFTNQTSITTETTLLYWYPENDSAATGGNYTFIVHWSNGTKVGFNLKYFWFTPIPANISVISELPTPYINDFTKSLTIRYNDSRGVNIVGATLYTELNGISLDWEDIYGRTLNIQDKGKYRIKLNTSGLTANQVYSLTGWIAKEGYVNTTFPSIQILVLPVPTLLVTNVLNITEYQNEMISFSCSFKDVFHGIGIDWAIIKYEIIDTNINGTLANIMPGESVYITEDVQLKNLIDRGTSYQINLTAIADNCESRSILIDLFVLNKTETVLTLLNVAGPYIQGRSLLIQARLQDDATGENIPNATIRFTFTGDISDRIALTDQNGIAEIEISVPLESFTITVWFDETSNMAQSTALSQSINVITYSDLALWIGILAAICVSSILAIRQFYVLPKRRRRMQEYTKIATKFMDIANIRHILIIHKETSACIYQQSFGPTLDADLISGFISAISTFQTELKPEKLPQKTVKTGGFELSYQDYKILLFHGDLIGIALIVEEPPSEDFRQKVQSFVREYESEYKSYLMEFRGNVGPFKTSGQLIADKLELSLLWPHQLYRPARTVKLSSMDEALIQIADTIMKSQVVNYFFLPLVISMGQAGMAKSKLEVIAAVYTLRQRTIFRATNPESIKE